MVPNSRRFTIEVAIAVEESRFVDAILDTPETTKAVYVFAHGAGAGMTHSFMATFAAGLVARDIAVLRYQFPYMQRGSRRTDSPIVAHATVRAAAREAVRSCPDTFVFAGGKSFGGRMTSQAQALEPLESVAGLVFVGFPLHPADKPSDERGRHLSDVRVPMLFLQGTKDDLADPARIGSVIANLGSLATLEPVAEADHSFHVLVRSGRNDGEVMTQLLDATAAWIDATIAAG